VETGRLRTYIAWTIGITLVLNLVFLVKDISDDVQEGAGLWHIGPEILIVIGTVVTAILALIQVRRMKERGDRFRQQVKELRVQNLDWQTRTKAYSQGLAVEIDRQFDQWSLSGAEKEIALLMLKGLSNREIAEVRQTSEHTIKQQSSAVYRKSGQSSRSELGAFFLEDLLSPPL
jgi:DNA-binding NarL/FixJ family response regulator